MRFLPTGEAAGARPGSTAALTWHQGLHSQFCCDFISPLMRASQDAAHDQSTGLASHLLGLLQEQPSSARCKLGATQRQRIPSVSSALLPLVLPPDHRGQRKLPRTSAGHCRPEHVPTSSACRLAGEKNPHNFRAFVFC